MPIPLVEPDGTTKHPTPSVESGGDQKMRVSLTESLLVCLASQFTLPWSAYVRLLSVKNSYAREFYEIEALRGGWSVRQLDRQINSQFYERTALSKDKVGMLKKGGLVQDDDTLMPEDIIEWEGFPGNRYFPTTLTNHFHSHVIRSISIYPCSLLRWT